MLNVTLDNLLYVHLLRTSLVECEQDYAKGALQLGHLIELVYYNARNLTAF